MMIDSTRATAFHNESPDQRNVVRALQLRVDVARVAEIVEPG